MNEEEQKEYEELKSLLYTGTISQYGKRKLIEIIEKQSKEIEELKREKETNQQMIHLAETQVLGYGQGYKDGLNKETTATAIVARERENQIIYEGMKHKINIQWVLKIKAKIEELNDGIKRDMINYDKVKDESWKLAIHRSMAQKIEIKKVLQSLLEKE